MVMRPQRITTNFRRLTQFAIWLADGAELFGWDWAVWARVVALALSIAADVAVARSG